jgi:L-ribulose-5-phosphate 3-epimerase
VGINKIGIMQGRLSPPISTRLQAFPWSSWKTEFTDARDCQIDLIEWLFEADDYTKNPIWNEDGIQAIQQQIKASGTGVLTCCADYFMPHPFFRVSNQERQESIHILEQLIRNAARIGVQTILVPVLEISEIQTPAEKDQLLESLREPLKVAEQKGVVLGLETELPAAEYLALVQESGSPGLGVYYDTGNNAAQGHDIAADARILAPRMVGIHVKDRKRGGSSVLLGEGDADFDGFFQVMRESGYANPVIMQTAFCSDYLGIARRHQQFVRSRLGSSDFNKEADLQ